jgi:hypothetical protein
VLPERISAGNRGDMTSTTWEHQTDFPMTFNTLNVVDNSTGKPTLWGGVRPGLRLLIGAFRSRYLAQVDTYRRIWT